MEGFINEDDYESRYEQKRRWNIYTNYDDAYEINHEDDEREELCEVHEPPVCNVRRYMMIKYSFSNDEEYVAIKENKYDDLTINKGRGMRAYQEIFRIMDEGWMKRLEKFFLIQAKDAKLAQDRHKELRPDRKAGKPMECRRVGRQSFPCFKVSLGKGCRTVRVSAGNAAPEIVGTFKSASKSWKFASGWTSSRVEQTVNIVDTGDQTIEAERNTTGYRFEGVTSPSSSPIPYEDSDYLVEETDILLSHFDDSPPEYETFSFDIEDKSSGSTTTCSDYSLPDYEAFCFDIDHIEEKSSGSTTTHSDFSLLEYDSFIFDLSIDPLPPADGSDFYHEEFADELAHIISPPEYDYFYFDMEADQGEFTNVLEKDLIDLSTKEFTSIELNNSPLLLYDCDSSLSIEFPEIDRQVFEDIVFDPGILIIKGVQF
ncbi:hypothetical protein Tco_0115226 [Tanacetum coccineum]